MIYEIKTVDGVKTKVPLTGNGYGLPLGTWISYEGTCPDGFIESEQTFNTTTYASLYAMLGTNKVPARFDHSKLTNWEDITLPNSQANAITMNYDGVIVASVESNQGRTHKLNISQDGGTTWKSIIIDQNYSDVVGGSATLNFNKGDMIYYSVNTTSNPIVSYIAYYKRHLAIKATPAYVEPDTVSDMVNTLRTQDSYSTEEVNTGKKWIDGKPIYRRTYNGDPTPLSIIATLNAFEDWNIPIPTNADTLIKSELRGFNNISKYYSFFFASASICFNNATGKLTMWSGSNTGTVKQATIWYTKSTD